MRMVHRTVSQMRGKRKKGGGIGRKLKRGIDEKKQAQLKELKAVIHILLVKWKDICYHRLNVLKNTTLQLFQKRKTYRITFVL